MLHASILMVSFPKHSRISPPSLPSSISLSLSGPLIRYSGSLRQLLLPCAQCPTTAFVSWVKELGSEDRTFLLNSRFAHETEWEHKACRSCALRLCTVGASSVFAECERIEFHSLSLLFTISDALHPSPLPTLPQSRVRKMGKKGRGKKE